MKINFISNLYPSDDKPYKGTFVRNIFEGFRARGCQVTLVSLRKENSGKINKLINYFDFFLRSFITGLKSNEDDVHYIHYTSHSSVGILAASLFKNPKKLVIVSNVHGSDILPEGRGVFPLFKFIISKKILAISTLIISPSNYFKNVLLDKYGVPEETILVSPSGGVDAITFDILPNAEKKYSYGYVGRLEKDKGIFDLLEAFSLSQLVNPQLKLLIVGSGSCEPQIREIIQSMTGVTLLQGMTQNQLVEIYNSINYLVFPSRAPESLGLIPIEAMMCGIPVLSSTTGATGEYITLEMRKFTFEPGDVKGLNTALNKAVNISDRDYLTLSQLARKVASDYSSSKVIDDLYRMFVFHFCRRQNK